MTAGAGGPAYHGHGPERCSPGGGNGTDDPGNRPDAEDLVSGGAVHTGYRGTEREHDGAGGGEHAAGEDDL